MRADAYIREVYPLIGTWIKTPPIGEYSGGLAKILALKPDKNAPEIVMHVYNPTYGEIGIFEWEDVEEVNELTTDTEIDEFT